MIKFGVGCFNFGLRYEGNLETNAGEYCNAVERALYQLPHVVRGSVDLDHSEDASAKVELRGPAPSLENGEGGFPVPSHFHLRFQLDLPPRVQQEVVAHLRMEPALPTPITINVIDAYEGPVTFVDFQSEDPSVNPSDAIVVLREYLKRELAHSTGPVYFEYLGPSPFHSDFSLQVFVDPITSTTPSMSRSGFVANIIPQFGYDNVDFRYLPSKYPSETDAYNDLIFELAPELAVFYAAVSCDARELNAWPSIGEAFDNLRALSARTGMWSEIKTLFECQALIRALFISLIDFQLLRTQNDATMRRAFKSTYETGVQTFLRNFVDDELRDRNTFPTEQVLALLEFLERRYMKVWEVTMLALASMIGALIGVLISSK